MSDSRSTVAEGGRPIAVALYRNLRRADLAGYHMHAELRVDTLVLRGEKGGLLTIPVAAIERLRVGFFETKTISWETLLWRIGNPDPVRLAPMQPLRDPHAYAGLVRALAARVAEQRGLGAVETGSSPAYWLSLFLMMAFLLAGALFVALFVLPAEPDNPWWAGPAVVAFPLAIVLLIAWRWHRLHRPRGITDLSALDRHLPRAT